MSELSKAQASLPQPPGKPERFGAVDEEIETGRPTGLATLTVIAKGILAKHHDTRLAADEFNHLCQRAFNKAMAEYLKRRQS